MNKSFKTTTHAKCILAGEHAVLRNYTLLAKSIKSYELELIYFKDKNKIQVDLYHSQLSSPETFNTWFMELIEKALKQVGRNVDTINGRFIVNSNIPLSAGLGFSAAISIAVTDWVISEGWLSEIKKFEFAKSLEDLFHGESSGADIAACMSDDIIIYKKPNSILIFHPYWQPKLYIQHTELKSVTYEAIKKVLAIYHKNPALGKSLDEKMNQATLTMIDALQDPSLSSITKLANAFNQAKECFYSWGLIPDEIDEKITILKNHGALAVKPTGAGNGGCLLSLWEKEPCDELRKILVPVF